VTENRAIIPLPLLANKRKVNAAASDAAKVAGGLAHTVEGGSMSRLTRVMRFLKDEDGASAAEYALILAVIGAGIGAAAVYLGDNIAAALNDAADCIKADGATC
jgi:pilus assembly protein Flp/PilA